MSHSSAEDNGSRSSSHGPTNLPRFIMDDVRLLFSDLDYSRSASQIRPAYQGKSVYDREHNPPAAGDVELGL